MSEYDGKVVYKVEADTSGVDDAISETEKAFKDAGDTIGKTGDGITSIFKGIAAAFSASKIIGFLKDVATESVNLASDLEEVQNVVDVTFGSGASAIEDWAKSAGTQFGLTELQAKKFTSTLGAMMKSAGLAGPEIVSMSTDLAGLAADMASFYNLDFDTAFQKIRAGISGETEPLKQLGVNMSVANLEAFALTQGITKSIEAMSQSEQVMLRYQYLMQATADAQGDFARTSDSLANTTRQLETNWTQIKQAVGSILKPAVDDAMQTITKLTGMLVPQQKERTILDEIADIDLNSQAKIQQIENTREHADILLGILRDIETVNTSKGVSTATSEADKLKTSTVTRWKTLSEAAKAVADGKGEATGVKNVKDAANQLEANKASVWGRLRDAITGIQGVTDVSGSANAVTTIQETATQLTADNVTPWQSFADSLERISGSTDGKTLNSDFFNSMKESSREQNGELSNLSKLAASLGINVGGITDANELWLATCRELVKTIPGLSSIINTQTGEIEGGTKAVEDYINAWADLEKGKVLWGAYNQKRSLIEQEFNDIPGLALDALTARRRMAKALEGTGLTGTDIINAASFGKQNMISVNGYTAEELLNLANAESTAEHALYSRYTAMQEAVKITNEEKEALIEMYPELEGYITATDDAADSTQEMSDKIKAAENALKDVGDYIEQTREETKRAIDGVANGFEEIQSPAEKARAEVKDLKKALESVQDEAKRGELEKQLKNADSAASNAVKTIQGMNRGLESQIAYYEEYNRRMEEAKKRGVSDDVLASLADGSQESYDYLEALSTASEGDIKKLNENYARLGQTKNTLVDTLTQQKLLVDETFNGLVTSAQNAVAQLDQSESAGAAVGKTVQGIIDGINAKYPNLVTAVDGILAQLSRLSGFSFSFGLGSSGFVSSSGVVRGGETITPLAVGADYIPFDGFLASLHEGEGVLTAEENRAWQAFKNGGTSVANSIDYGRLSGEIWDKAPSMGGNVYLDGQTVGRVMSAQQADSLRRLTRSGWQA